MIFGEGIDQGMKLSSYAKKLGVSYQTAWNHYKAGLTPNAKQLPTGIIVIDDDRKSIPENDNA
jgi:putative resolvase